MAQALVSAYLHACRHLMGQWAANILFCETSVMTKRNETVVDHDQQKSLGARCAAHHLDDVIAV